MLPEELVTWLFQEGCFALRSPTMIVSMFEMSRAAGQKGSVGIFINSHESHFGVSQEGVDRSVG